LWKRNVCIIAQTPEVVSILRYDVKNVGSKNKTRSEYYFETQLDKCLHHLFVHEIFRGHLTAARFPRAHTSSEESKDRFGFMLKVHSDCVRRRTTSLWGEFCDVVRRRSC
jgi:hypothetical protein